MEYKIGDVYKNEAFPNRISTIIDVSPKVDYDEGLSYFVMDNEKGQITFSVEYEVQLKEWCTKIDTVNQSLKKQIESVPENPGNYKLNEEYIHTEAQDLHYTIFSVSPIRDFENELSYFCEVRDNSNSIWYDVHYESDMNKVLKKVNPNNDYKE